MNKSRNTILNSRESKSKGREVGKIVNRTPENQPAMFCRNSEGKLVYQRNMGWYGKMALAKFRSSGMAIFCMPGLTVGDYNRLSDYNVRISKL